MRPFSSGATIGDEQETANRCKVMAEAGDNTIRLTIKGARAQRGVSLSDFESFIDSFLAALRDYDRAGRGESTRKSGHPDRRAEAATAFRLVGFRPGSGVATIEPDFVAPPDDQLGLDDVPLSLMTLRALADDLAAERSLPEPVLDALGKACRAVGADGSVSIDLPDAPGGALLVDGALLDRVATAKDDAARGEVTAISGRLHLLDLEPDRLGIRTASGVEWSCRYPEAIEQRVKGLLDRVVWVAGRGSLTSPLRGTMIIERIEPVEAEQSALFTTAAIDEDELLACQGITAPQGLDSLSEPEWDDAIDGAYVTALLSK